MSSNKRRRARSSDKVLRLLPECKWQKQAKGAMPVVAFKQTARQQASNSMATIEPVATVYHQAVDLARMSKTAVAYYTAVQGSGVVPDRVAARGQQKAQTVKCTNCGKDLEEGSSLLCGGKCGKMCHPGCCLEIERFSAEPKWVCFKCAGVPR